MQLTVPEMLVELKVGMKTIDVFMSKMAWEKAKFIWPSDKFEVLYQLE
jgi:hypothetical protein